MFITERVNSMRGGLGRVAVVRDVGEHDGTEGDVDDTRDARAGNRAEVDRDTLNVRLCHVRRGDGAPRSEWPARERSRRRAGAGSRDAKSRDAESRTRREARPRREAVARSVGAQAPRETRRWRSTHASAEPQVRRMHGQSHVGTWVGTPCVERACVARARPGMMRGGRWRSCRKCAHVRGGRWRPCRKCAHMRGWR